jgi:hypothetical protein
MSSSQTSFVPMSLNQSLDDFCDQLNNVSVEMNATRCLLRCKNEFLLKVVAAPLETATIEEKSKWLKEANVLRVSPMLSLIPYRYTNPSRLEGLGRIPSHLLPGNPDRMGESLCRRRFC